MEKEYLKIYRIVDKRKETDNLEGIVEFKRPGIAKYCYKKIEVANWNAMPKLKSFWVSFYVGKHQIVVDSGVIEELADEIKKLKRKELPNSSQSKGE